MSLKRFMALLFLLKIAFEKGIPLTGQEFPIFRSRITNPGPPLEMDLKDFVALERVDDSSLWVGILARIMRNEGYSYRHVLGANAKGQTALHYLVHHFAHSSESQWQASLDAGEVLLNGRKAEAAEKLEAGGILVWNRPGWIEEPVPKTYEVVYCDSSLLVVSKPSGLPTIPGGGFYRNTLLSLVQTEHANAKPLHRLGRATSGLVMFALNPEVASQMSRHWSQVRKQYRALGTQIAHQDDYEIHTPIGERHHPRLGKVFAASPAGKTARSTARVLQRRIDATLFEVDLHTGRPHQIRIHLASIGHPLVGDPLYDVGGEPKKEDPGLPGDSGYWLHAHRLAFNHPMTGESMVLSAELPDILRSGLD